MGTSSSVPQRRRAVRILLARHGQSVANVERVISNRDLPYGLTTLGRWQAVQLADRLRTDGVGALYCSPIPRARETAAVVGERLGLIPVVADGLREPDRGVLEGRGDPEAWRLHDELTRRWLVDVDHAARSDGGESLDDVRQRFEAFLASLVDEHAGGDASVLCITHGALMLTVLPLVLSGVPSSATSGSIAHATPVVAVYGDEGWQCVTWCGEALLTQHRAYNLHDRAGGLLRK
jgi:broad specificity phosphatase PhoE